MEQINLDYKKDPEIREIVNKTPKGLIFSDVRLLNALKCNAKTPLADLIEDGEGRMKIMNWGVTTEAKFTADIAVFLLRSLTKSRNGTEAPIEPAREDLETYDRVRRMKHLQLKELYRARHRIWWELAHQNKRADHPMFLIGGHVGFKWPTRHMELRLSSFERSNPDELLKLRGYGIKKRDMVLKALVWAALGPTDIPEHRAMDGKSAYKIAGLTRIERDILHARYGTSEEATPTTLDEVGKMYGRVTRERIRQIEAGAVEKMKLLGLQKAVHKWLIFNADYVWSRLANNDGTIKGYGIEEKSLQKMPRDLALSFRIADIAPYDILVSVGEIIGREWIRRASNQEQNS
jgi:hypothetical protein